jgi:hypothetical protein
MKYKVVFFTRTNNSKRIAEKISKKLSCEAVQITDNKNWNGIFGFIKAGYYSSTNKKVEIQILGNLNSVDEYIVVTPLWAGGIAPATRTFLKTIPLDKVHLVVTSDGSHVKSRSGYKSVSDITKNKMNEDLVINYLLDILINNSSSRRK